MILAANYCGGQWLPPSIIDNLNEFSREFSVGGERSEPYPQQFFRDIKPEFWLNSLRENGLTMRFMGLSPCGLPLSLAFMDKQDKLKFND
jgi:hypothetical protein